MALSFGLAMDATAVSAVRGLAGHLRRELVILPIVFGGFQAGMSALGWLAGKSIGPYIARWKGPVALGLLALIGLKMIVDGVRGEAEEPEHVPRGTLGIYFGLGIATSIDAAAAGLTLEDLTAPPWLSILLIGAVTAACSGVGYGAGRAIGGRIGPRLGILGGLVLVGIGIDIWIGSR
ncbi:MAG: manganese efflux pump MntP family protein [Acidobacteriota bacterium]